MSPASIARYRDWPAWYDLRAYVVLRNALTERSLRGLSESVLESPFLAANTLNYRFAGTRGFSIIFRREGLPRLEKQFPAFAAYLPDILNARCNAFFLNPLVIARGSRVAPHVDRSLRSWTSPEEPPDPVKVVVLYLEVPPRMSGGRLILHGNRPLVEIEPVVNKMVQFRGHLRHEVTELDAPEPEEGVSPTERVSLVCEQYRLPESLLERIPEYEVRSKRPFEEFLQAELGPQAPLLEEEAPIEDPIEDPGTEEEAGESTSPGPAQPS